MLGRSKNSVAQPFKARKQVPAILQMEAVECGAASLAMILAYYGKWVPLEEMRESCGVSRDGSRASSILKAARKYGLEAKGFREEVETLGKHRCPSILFWNFNHFVVLTGKKGNKYCINDPAVGPREVTELEFDEAFTGVVLTFEPGPEFKKGGQRSNLFVSLYRKLGNARSGVLFAFLTGLLLVLPMLAYPAFQQVFVDKIIIGQYLEWFYPMLSLMAVSLFLVSGLMWLQSSCILRTNLRLSINASVQFLHHVFRLPMSFFNQRMPGELSYRVYLNDKVANLLSGKLASNLLNLLLIFFYACVMLSFDGVLTVITVTMALLNLLALNLISKKRVLINQSLQQEQGKLMGTSMAGLQLIETIKATGSESNYFATWAGHQAKLESSKQKMGVTSTYLMSLPEFLTSLNTVIILVLGSLKIMGGDLSIGMLIAYQSLVALFLAPVTKLVNLGADLQEMRVDVDRLDDVLKHQKDPIYQQEAEEAELDAVADWQAFDGAIELKDISFGYNPTAAPLITDFNLRIEPGQRVAIVGGSGSGKSSLIKLIAGLYQPWSGSILFDGKPRNEIPRHLLNLSMSMVDQDIALFEGSIRENLTMWDASLPEERIIRACRDACIHDEIAQRPGAYDDRVEENGRNFSGGQRQRLEIARALINRPSILLLDEATSALDPAMEKQIDRNIRRNGATCVIVAHRLSTIRDCDEIIVMEKGNIVERGTHEQLVSEKGAYYELVKTI